MVSRYLAPKYQLGTLFLLETGPPFYAVILATRSLAACSAEGVPSFLSYVKTLSINLAPGIGPATFRSAVKRSTD